MIGIDVEVEQSILISDPSGAEIVVLVSENRTFSKNKLLQVHAKKTIYSMCMSFTKCK